MSGPKLSAAEIEARRKAQLERERQERLRRLRDAQEKYNISKALVDELKNQLMELLGANIDSVKAVFAESADMLSASVNQLLAHMVMEPVENSASEDAWIHSAVKSREKALELFAEGKALIEQEANRIGVFHTKSWAASQQAAVSEAIENTLREEVLIQKSMEFSPVLESGIEKQASICLHELRELLDMKQTPMLKTARALADEMENILPELVRGQKTNIERKVQDLINREQDLIDEIEECEAL